MIIALDFDGTLAVHEWPDIGEDIGAFSWLLQFQQDNIELRYILWTVRSGRPLMEAIKLCECMGLRLWGINENPEQNWSPSNKAHAHVYVDDAALGAPLIYPSENGMRPYIDWHQMGPMLEDRIESYFSAKKRAKEQT
jgi:hypothetical protein